MLESVLVLRPISLASVEAANPKDLDRVDDMFGRGGDRFRGGCRDQHVMRMKTSDPDLSGSGS